MSKIVSDRIRNIYEDVQDRTIVEDLRKKSICTKSNILR